MVVPESAPMCVLCSIFEFSTGTFLGKLEYPISNFRVKPHLELRNASRYCGNGYYLYMSKIIDTLDENQVQDWTKSYAQRVCTTNVEGNVLHVNHTKYVEGKGAKVTWGAAFALNDTHYVLLSEYFVLHNETAVELEGPKKELRIRSATQRERFLTRTQLTQKSPPIFSEITTRAFASIVVTDNAPFEVPTQKIVTIQTKPAPLEVSTRELVSPLATEHAPFEIPTRASTSPIATDHMLSEVPTKAFTSPDHTQLNIKTGGSASSVVTNRKLSDIPTKLLASPVVTKLAPFENPTRGFAKPFMSPLPTNLTTEIPTREFARKFARPVTTDLTSFEIPTRTSLSSVMTNSEPFEISTHKFVSPIKTETEQSDLPTRLFVSPVKIEPASFEIPTQMLANPVKTKPASSEIPTRGLASPVKSAPVLFEVSTPELVSPVLSNNAQVEVPTRKLISSVKTKPASSEVPTRELSSPIKTKPVPYEIPTRELASPEKTHPVPFEIPTHKFVSPVKAQPAPFEDHTHGFASPVKTEPSSFEIPTREFKSPVKMKPEPLEPTRRFASSVAERCSGIYCHGNDGTTTLSPDALVELRSYFMPCQDDDCLLGKKSVFEYYKTIGFSNGDTQIQFSVNKNALLDENQHLLKVYGMNYDDDDENVDFRAHPQDIHPETPQKKKHLQERHLEYPLEEAQAKIHPYLVVSTCPPGCVRESHNYHLTRQNSRGKVNTVSVITFFVSFLLFLL